MAGRAHARIAEVQSAPLPPDRRHQFHRTGRRKVAPGDDRLCERWDVAAGLEWLGRGRAGTKNDPALDAVAAANIAAWSERLPTSPRSASREKLPRLPGGFTEPEVSLRTPAGRYHGDPLYAVVARRADGTQLWGSDMMGTWTVLLERGDTHCVIASGIGYQDGVDPGAFYAKVGLG